MSCGSAGDVTETNTRWRQREAKQHRAITQKHKEASHDHKQILDNRQTLNLQK